MFYLHVEWFDGALEYLLEGDADDLWMPVEWNERLLYAVKT
jgi:hypothetical protein